MLLSEPVDRPLKEFAPVRVSEARKYARQSDVSKTIEI